MRISPSVQNVIAGFAAVMVSFLAYSALGSSGRELIYIVNFFSIIVIFGAVKKGGPFGTVLGAACGLLQDSFSYGVFGVAGLTKTVLGFLTGGISRRMDVSSPGRNFLFVLVMAALETVLWAALVALVRRQSVFIDHGLMLLQPFVTALLVSAALHFEARFRKRRGR